MCRVHDESNYTDFLGFCCECHPWHFVLTGQRSYYKTDMQLHDRFTHICKIVLITTQSCIKTEMAHQSEIVKNLIRGRILNRHLM